MKRIILALSAFLLVLSSCYKDNAEDMYPGSGGSSCDTTNVTFAATIKPVLDARCATAGCHAGAATTGIDLSTHSGAAAVASSGQLLDAINQNGQAAAMPQGQPKLDDCTIAKITKWVNDGAPNN